MTKGMMAISKTIGFIDYFIDNWHSNNYPGWIRADRGGEAWDVGLVYAMRDKEGGIGTDDYCAKFGARRAGSIEEVAEGSDAIFVLSPNNSEFHEELSRIPLASGKPIFVDKTFAPDLAAARRMTERAKEHNTPLLSCSSLRYADEILPLLGKPLEYVMVQGPGKFATYAVHLFEQVVALMGVGARSIRQAGTANVPSLSVDYGDGRAAHLMQHPAAPYTLAAVEKGGAGHYFGELRGYFENQVAAMLRFFETGVTPVPVEATLEVMALIEAGRKALERPGEAVAVG